MKNTDLKIYSETGRYPEYGTSGSAAFDIETKEDITWEIYGENCTTTFGTGLYVIIPEGHVLKIFPRSGFGFKYEMALMNTVGVIDSDFRGEIKIKLKAPRRFHDLLPTKKGTRIVQAILEKIPKVNIVKVSKEVIENDKTDRGEGGFGSTGETK